MKVTCIIPCYNHADTVNRAIESVIEQVDSIIIIDDASNDSPTDAILKQFGENEKINILHTLAMMPAGVCHARNLGITHAYDGLILPLDADDWIAPDIVAKMVDVWKPGSFVYGNWIQVTDKGESIHRPPPLNMIRTKNVGFASYLYHKADWYQAGGYPSQFNIGGEHWGLMAAMVVKHRVKPIYLDETIFYYNRQKNARFITASKFHRTITRLVGDVISGY